MKQQIDKNGLLKSVTQIKSKLRNMKDVYKKAKDNTVKLELHQYTHRFIATSKKCWDPEMW